MRFAVPALVLLCPLAGCAHETRRISDQPPPARPATGPLTKPALPPLSQPSYSVSAVAEQELPAVPAYAYVSARTTVRDVQSAIAAAMAELSTAAGAGRLTFAGPATFVYRGATGELDKPFTLEVGFPVAAGTPPTGRVQVRPLPALRAVAATFTGPVSAIDKAYDKVVPEVQRRKLRPAGEAREVYLKWDGPEAGDNQVLVAVGVQQ